MKICITEGFLKKINLFLIELKHISLKNIKHLFLNPCIASRYIGTFFNYNMVINPEIHKEEAIKKQYLEFCIFGDFEEYTIE